MYEICAASPYALLSIRMRKLFGGTSSKLNISSRFFLALVRNVFQLRAVLATTTGSSDVRDLHVCPLSICQVVDVIRQGKSDLQREKLASRMHANYFRRTMWTNYSVSLLVDRSLDSCIPTDVS